MEFGQPPDAFGLRDRIYALLDDFEPIAIQDHETEDGIRVFFRSAGARNRAAAALHSSFPALAISGADVDDEDWAQRTQAGLRAVRVRGVTVAPPWDVPTGGGTIIVVIEPSMGFGTGHHATTRLCLDLLQDRPLHDARVIDVGTGSGVLAIAAARLGAASVVALDNDPDALANARDNVTRNAADRVRIVQADLRELPGTPADLVLANLTAPVLQRHAPALQALVAAGGTLVVSGFGPHERDEVVDAIGWSPAREIVDGEWMAISLPRPA